MEYAVLELVLLHDFTTPLPPLLSDGVASASVRKLQPLAQRLRAWRATRIPWPTHSRRTLAGRSRPGARPRTESYFNGSAAQLL